MDLRPKYHGFPTSLRTWFSFWMIGFAEILDGVILVLSLGILNNDLSYRASVWYSREHWKKEKK